MAPRIVLETITKFSYITSRTSFYSVFHCTSPLWRNRPEWARVSSQSRLHDHTHTHHTRYDCSGRVKSLTQWQHKTLKETDIHAAGEIRTRNPRKRPASDPRFSQRGLGPTLLYIIITKIKAKEQNTAKIHKLGSHFQRQPQLQWAPSQSRNVQARHIK